MGRTAIGLNWCGYIYAVVVPLSGSPIETRRWCRDYNLLSLPSTCMQTYSWTSTRLRMIPFDFMGQTGQGHWGLSVEGQGHNNIRKQFQDNNYLFLLSACMKIYT